MSQTVQPGEDAVESGTDNPQEPGEAAAIERLRRHAEDAVALGSVPRTERTELAEEFYSGLWEHWRADVDAGTSADVAVDRAIAAFGGQTELGRDLASVYHSRLYAATVGTLLPGAVSASRQRPLDTQFAVAFVVVMAALSALAAVTAFASLSPTRAIVVSLLSATTAAIWALCARALARDQRWALAVGRFLVVIALVTGAGSLLSGNAGIPIMGVFALVAMVPLFGRDLAEWVRPSPGIGWRLGLAVAVIPLAAMGAGFFPGWLPEVTAASANDLHLDAVATCPQSASASNELTVVATFKWDRLDPWPGGILPGSPPQDWISVWIQGMPAMGAIQMDTLRGGSRYFQLHWRGGGTVEDLTEPGPSYMMVSDPPSDSDAPKPGAAVGADLGPAIPVNDLRAGHRYQVTWSTLAVEAPVVDSIDHVVVTYDHLGQVGVQAVATCQSSGTGVRVDPPFPLP